MMTTKPDPALSVCPLCVVPLPGELVRSENWAVIDAQDPTYPGLTRVVWLAHVAEMTDLPNSQRQTLMQVVFTVEATMRERLQPDKVNLASLGNMVPHLHWHVIPRWRDDATFPDSIWSPANDSGLAQQRRIDIQGSLKDYHQVLIQRLNQL